MNHKSRIKKIKQLFHDPCSMLHEGGFTLIEAIVAASVFAFVVTSVLGVYISVIQLDRKSRAQRAVAENARFIMDFFAKEVRNGVINYSSPGWVVSNHNDLYVQNQANIVEHFSLNGSDIVFTKGSSSTNLNSSGVKVASLAFYVAPIGEPYISGCSTASTCAYNEQPHVTVVMKLVSNYGARATDLITMNLQDTYTIRSYPSRQ